MAGGRRGFTLIELMIVVAIIGVLAAIAVPKFSELIRKSREGETKGNLGAIRSALSIYYADNEGHYPSDDLASLTASSKYLAALPPSVPPDYHGELATVRNNQSLGCGAIYSNDQGGWTYWSDDGSLCGGVPGPASDSRHQGDIWIGCVHTDTKGSVWTSY